MAIQVLKKENLITSVWTGGTTTQLYISPENADLSKKDFDFRISTATVVQEESDFTPMPGFGRKLMVLKGELQIEHAGHHSIFLKAFEQDQFSGDWQTKSKGTVVDFNVIYRPEFHFDLFEKELIAGGEFLYETNLESMIYVFKGSIEINSLNVTEGDFIWMENLQNTVIQAIQTSILIIVDRKN